MIIHMRHTLWTGISETNVNIITSATRTHAFNNNNNPALTNDERYEEISTVAQENDASHIGSMRTIV